MTQGLLPFQYQAENNHSKMTSFSGLPLYMDLAQVSGLCSAIAKQLRSKKQGWLDVDIVMSIILLNLVGGDCVEDIERLENDAGLRTLLLKLQTHGMRRKQRRAYEHRWRKSSARAFPSVSAIHRYLEQFHNAPEECLREQGRAFIPSNNDLMIKLLGINNTLLDYAQKHQPCRTATLDQDATLSASHKQSALFCYKKFKAYQPFNTYWHEHGLIVHSEFRDGNVNAGFEQLRLLKASLAALPMGVDTVYLRSDSAGYQRELMEYCAEGDSERFGVIEFAIASRVTTAFKEAVSEVPEAQWHSIYKTDDQGNVFETDQQWADVCFVPTWAATKKPSYRYLAIRERFVEQQELEGIESTEPELPFQTHTLANVNYKLFGVVTNRTIDGNELINWHRKRCGKSEALHSIEKSDLAGGQFPSNKFGANAAWWQMMVLSSNLHQLMSLLALPKPLKTKRMKAIRLHIINVAGRVIQHARRMFLQLSGGADTYQLITDIRQKIAALAQAPPVVMK